MRSHVETGEFEPSHPALPGHFPGDPVVPGVLILARVARAACAAFGNSMDTLPLAKFHARLKPGERYTIRLEQKEDARVRFEVSRGADTIASGELGLGA